MTKTLKEIRSLPKKDQRAELRKFVSYSLEQKAHWVKTKTGKTWSAFRDSLPMDRLNALADIIDTRKLKVEDLDTIAVGDISEIGGNDKPLLEGVSPEELLILFLDIKEETECNGKDQIVLAVKNSCRIHSSFEPIFNSAVEVWDDIPISSVEREWESAEAFDKLRDCHSAACAYITGEKAEETTTPSDSIAKPSAEQSAIVNTVMDSLGLPKVEVMIDRINDASKVLLKKDNQIADLEQRVKQQALAPVASAPIEAKEGTDIPKGKIVLHKAYQIFGMSKDKFDFDVPVWEWDAPNPHVPEIDKDYIFRPEELMKFLYALLMNQRAYFYGDTGTGKTTLIEQGAARLGNMFSRINFDSEVSRYDLIGRDVLTTEGGKTVSKFVDGKLPQMMAGPFIGCFDEIDFVRPDVAYVMQSALEGNGLVITEDGGRIVKPHAGFRMFATGNTCGQGDEKGMYQGARPQSMALLDRFTVWAKIDYLDAKQRKKLVEKKCPTLEKTYVDIVCQYVTEHLRAFRDAKVLQPISPRGMISLGNAITTFTALDPSHKDQAIKRAFATTITDRATSQDFAVLNGIVDRVVK